METKFAKIAYRSFLIWGIFSSLGITVCTLVDAFLVGNLIGSNGLAVVNISTPIFLTYQLFGLTIGVGCGVLIGGKLGESDADGANRIFNKGVFICIAASVLCLVLSALFADEICRFLGANDELLLFAKQYLTISLISAPLFILYHFLSVAVRTDSDPKLVAIAAATVVITNILMDILFMLVLDWGMIGASASLCIAVTLGFLVLLLHFVKKHSLLRFRFSIPRLPDITRYIANGFGVASIFIFQAIVMLIFNVLLLSGSNGVTNVAIFGIMYTMGLIPFAVFEGTSNAVSTVVSIFTGERDIKSILIVLQQAIKITILFSALIAAAFILGTEGIVRFFGLSGELYLDTAVSAFQIFTVSILFAGINTVLISFWQAIGRAKLAGIMSIMRNFSLMLVLGFALISKHGIIGVSATYLLSEVLCLIGSIAIALVGGSKAYIAKKYQSPKRIYEKYYTIKEESIGQISADLQGLCENWEVSASQTFYINLIIEELLLNIIKFGLADTTKGYYVAVKLLDNGGEYIIRIHDNVNTYNPFDSAGDDIDRAAIKMITRKAKYYNYQRKLVFNYLHLII